MTDFNRIPYQEWNVLFANKVTKFN